MPMYEADKRVAALDKAGLGSLAPHLSFSLSEQQFPSHFSGTLGFIDPLSSH